MAGSRRASGTTRGSQCRCPRRRCRSRSGRPRGGRRAPRPWCPSRRARAWSPRPFDGDSSVAPWKPGHDDHLAGRDLVLHPDRDPRWRCAHDRGDASVRMPAWAPVSEMAGTPIAWSAIAIERAAHVLAGREQEVHLARIGIVGDARRRARAGGRWCRPSRTRRPRDRSPRRARAAMRRATWRMRSASARDEPPYFWTTSWGMPVIIPKVAGMAG